jgi:hypothetical protein
MATITWKPRTDIPPAIFAKRRQIGDIIVWIVLFTLMLVVGGRLGHGESTVKATGHSAVYAK